MAKEAPATLTLRITPNSRDLLKLAAERDHRSMANMVEVLIINHCKANGIALDAKRKTSKPNT